MQGHHQGEQAEGDVGEGWGRWPWLPVAHRDLQMTVEARDAGLRLLNHTVLGLQCWGLLGANPAGLGILTLKVKCH